MWECGLEHSLSENLRKQLHAFPLPHPLHKLLWGRLEKFVTGLVVLCVGSAGNISSLVRSNSAVGLFWSPFTGMSQEVRAGMLLICFVSVLAWSDTDRRGCPVIGPGRKHKLSLFPWHTAKKRVTCWSGCEGFALELLVKWSKLVSLWDVNVDLELEMRFWVGCFCCSLQLGVNYWFPVCVWEGLLPSSLPLKSEMLVTLSLKVSLCSSPDYRWFPKETSDPDLALRCSSRKWKEPRVFPWQCGSLRTFKSGFWRKLGFKRELICEKISKEYQSTHYHHVTHIYNLCHFSSNVICECFMACWSVLVGLFFPKV